MEDIITIDGAGRVVVPKALRAKLNLREGTRLLVRAEGDSRLILEPVSEESTPADRDGLLVIRGRLVDEIPDHRRQRAERIRTLGRTRR